MAAITGNVTTADDFGVEAPVITLPETFANYENYFIYPPEDRAGLSVVMGPNIKPFPISDDLSDTLSGSLLLKTGDNITTDDIMPSNAKLLPFRSNIPELSKYCFGTIIPDFKMRAEAAGGGFVIGGDNYGQGSSREHAALVPLYLGVKAVIAKSFARIHKKNLINSGILPLVFVDPADYDRFSEEDELVFKAVHDALAGKAAFEVINQTQGFACPIAFEGSDRDVEVLMVGGTLNFTKKEILS
jgi:aconitate hydratase